MHQLEMLSLEDLIPLNHSYRKFASIWTFEYASKALRKIEKENPYKGYGKLRLFKCLLLQFMEDLSDRELEKYLQENNAAKWFCGFSLLEKTPDFSVFSKLRTLIGAKGLSKIFNHLREQLKQQGLMNEVFSVVDASQLISKASLWKERDDVIKKKYEKLNNETLPIVAVDKEARIGCKGSDKFWYGYKKHVSIETQSGLINKVAVTAANVTDAKGLKNVCPDSGAVYTDKAYCTAETEKDARKRGCYLRAIKKNNMKGKNKEQDRWFTHLRSPYERVFSKENKRVRYRGLIKNQFAQYMQAICFNLKRLLVLDPLKLQLA